jgi:hypothetical protein
MLLLFSCAANILVPLILIPKFQHIYPDLLPGQPLPELTQWIISVRMPLMIAGAVWAIVGILIVWMLKSTSGPWLLIPFFLSLGQMALSLYALFQPMLGILSTGSLGPHS